MFGIIRIRSPSKTLSFYVYISLALLLLPLLHLSLWFRQGNATCGSLQTLNIPGTGQAILEQGDVALSGFCRSNHSKSVWARRGILLTLLILSGLLTGLWGWRLCQQHDCGTCVWAWWSVCVCVCVCLCVGVCWLVGKSGWECVRELRGILIMAVWRGEGVKMYHCSPFRLQPSQV